MTAVTGAPGVYARRLRPGQAVLLSGTGERAWTPSPAPATTVDYLAARPCHHCGHLAARDRDHCGPSPTATATNRDPGAPATNAAPARPRDHGRDHDRPATATAATATAATAAAASAAAAGDYPQSPNFAEYLHINR